GKVAHDYRVFWMGHKGSMEARYTTNKGRLPQSLIDDMREAYRRCEPLLSTIPIGGERDAQSKIAKVMLMGLGYTEEELSTVDFDSMDMATFQELVTKKVPSGGSRAQQRLAHTDELPGLLKEGWRVVTAVNGHQVVLEPPSHP
ncbi:integrase/recombinase, partial [mine drainage metagenome]